MTNQSASHPTFYLPGEVAKRLRCSEWWIKEQARKRRIPYSWIGGRYLFTDEHIAAIVALSEQRPIRPAEPAGAQKRSPKRGESAASGAVVKLRARKPKRARTAEGESPAA